jgi:hypothetical protein
VSDKVNATTAAAAAKAAEVSAAAGAKYDEKMYGDVYKTFQEFDADGSGELDNAEVPPPPRRPRRRGCSWTGRGVGARCR